MNILPPKENLKKELEEKVFKLERQLLDIEKTATNEKHVFQQVMENSEAISVQGYNEEHVVIYWNKASEKIYGYSNDEAIDKKLEDLIIPPPAKEMVKKAVDDWIENDIPVPSSELTLIDKNGNSVEVFSQHVAIRNNSNDFEMYCMDIDLGEIKKREEELKIFAHFDTLTGLTNRTVFMDRLSQLVNTRKSKDIYQAVLFIDLDKFKEVNDSMGHSVGDELLILVATRLKDVIRQGDTLSRFGGDEFTILLENIEKPLTASVTAQKVNEILREPFHLQHQNFYITSSIGISIFPDDSSEAEELLQYADSAMYKAKDKAKDTFEFYTKELSTLAMEKISTVNSLRHAIKNEEFELYYQAQTDARLKQTIGAEALIRWNHPTKGLVSPLNFSR